jgi:hypothetical protein
MIPNPRVQYQQKKISRSARPSIGVPARRFLQIPLVSNRGTNVRGVYLAADHRQRGDKRRDQPVRLLLGHTLLLFEENNWNHTYGGPSHHDGGAYSEGGLRHPLE